MKKFPLIMTVTALLLCACSLSGLPTSTPAAFDVTAGPPTETPTPTGYAPDANFYSNAEGGFTLAIPAGWNVAGPMAADGYNLYTFGTDPASSGGPGLSQVIIADAGALTIEQFAAQMCGTCPSNPIEDTNVAGLPARRTLIGGGSAPEAEWVFVTHNGKLLGFSFRPTADTAVDWILGTLRFDSAAPSPSSAAAGWVAYRDAYYGYGIAIPCWWVVNPTGEHGGAMSLRSYDDAFFRAHSSKGEWTDGIAPQGAVKLDFVVIENLDPAADTETLIRQNSPAEDEIVSTTPADFNGHPALLVEFKHTTSDPVTYVKVYFLRFGPDKLLLVAGYPYEGLQSADVQAVLHSLTFSGSENIAFPTTAPGPALGEMPESCK